MIFRKYILSADTYRSSSIKPVEAYNVAELKELDPPFYKQFK